MKEGETVKKSYLATLLSAVIFSGLIPVYAESEIKTNMPAPQLYMENGAYKTELTELPLNKYHYTAPAVDMVTEEGYDAYFPGFSKETPGDGAPVISGITKQADTDRSFIIEGEGFLNAEVKLYAQTTSGNGKLYDANIISSTDTNITAIVPADAPYGMYFVWVVNENGASYPAAVNRTELWWIGRTEVKKGGELSVYGANLTYNNGEGPSHIYLKTWSSGNRYACIPLETVSTDPFKAVVKIPQAVEAGEYEVWASNGHGGKYGFSGPLKVTVTDKAGYKDGIEAFTRGNIVDVTKYGADGTDDKDDYNGINLAISAAQNGDTLYFPAGTYYSSAAIRCDKALYWKGENEGNTVIKVGEGFKKTDRLVTIEAFPAAVTNLSFMCDAQNYISGALLYFRGYGKDPVKDKTNMGSMVDSCIFSSATTSEGTVGIEAQNFINFSVTNCTIEASRTIALTGMQRVTIRNNDMTGNYMQRPGDGRPLNLFWTVNNIDFSDNTARSGCWQKDYIEDGDPVINRFLVIQNHYGESRNVYIAENSVNTAGHPHDNSGEQILFENGCVKLPEVDRISKDTIYFKRGSIFGSEKPVPEDNKFKKYNDDNEYQNMSLRTSVSVLIVNGKGAGQTRQVKKNIGNAITVDRPWDIQPDNTSVFELAYPMSNTAVYKNYIDALKNNQFANDNASAGVNCYGPMYDSFIKANTFKNVGNGVVLFGRYDADGNINMVSNVLVDDNSIENTQRGLYAVLMTGNVVKADKDKKILGTVLRNNMFRGNSVKNCVDTKNFIYTGWGGYGIAVGRAIAWPTMSIANGQFDWPGGWVLNQVFENNTIDAVELSKARLREFQRGTVLRDNNFGYDEIYFDDDITVRDEILAEGSTLLDRVIHHSVVVNYSDSPISFDRNRRPVIQDDDIYIPLRDFLTKLGVAVAWNEDKQTVSFIIGNIVYSLCITDSMTFIDGDLTELKSFPYIENGVTMISCGAIEQLFGMNISRTEEIYKTIIDIKQAE